MYMEKNNMHLEKRRLFCAFCHLMQRFALLLMVSIV